MGGLIGIMWSLKPIYQKKKGFTLIELMVSIALVSIILLPLYNALNISVKACESGARRDDLMLNARFALEYIKLEVKSGDRILPSSAISGLNNGFKKNIGFVIVTNIDDSFDRYTTYYVRNNRLIRVSGKQKKDSLPIYTVFEGYNEVCESIESVNESSFDMDNKLLKIRIKMESLGGDQVDLNTEIFLMYENNF